MDLQRVQFEAAVYIFEKANGRELSHFEDEQIAKSGMEGINPDLLASQISLSLNDDATSDVEIRVIAYWALSKRYDKALIPDFQIWLQKELSSKDKSAVFQILIALDNMDEPVFGEDRDGGYAAHETTLNIRDAENYLAKINNC